MEQEEEAVIQLQALTDELEAQQGVVTSIQLKERLVQVRTHFDLPWRKMCVGTGMVWSPVHLLHHEPLATCVRCTCWCAARLHK